MSWGILVKTQSSFPFGDHLNKFSWPFFLDDLLIFGGENLCWERRFIFQAVTQAAEKKKSDYFQREGGGDGGGTTLKNKVWQI